MECLNVSFWKITVNNAFVHYEIISVSGLLWPYKTVNKGGQNNVLCFCVFQVTQIEFNQRAPAGCRQYYQGSNGVYISNQLLFCDVRAFENKLGQ